MALLTFSAALIIPRLKALWKLILSDPVVYFSIIAIWLLYEVYFIIRKEEGDVENKGVNLIDNAVSSIYIALLISPVFQNAGKISMSLFTNPTPRTLLSMILFGYAAFLAIAAFTNLLPGFIIFIIGGSAFDTLLTFLALIYVDGKLPIDLTTIVAIAIPISIVMLIKLIRRVT